MLHEFLTRERASILALCREKTLAVGSAKASSPELERGLPTFYEELIEILTRSSAPSTAAPPTDSTVKSDRVAASHGKESLRLGYTVSQVVQGYGALCQAITEYAQKKGAAISSGEFQELNGSIDVAIAEAVTEFSRGQLETVNREEITRLGFLAHELRNSLVAATMAHDLIKKGVVGTAGSTSRILSFAHERMRDLIDHALSEVRLQREPVAHRELLRVIDLVGEVEATATGVAHARSVNLRIEVDSRMTIHADRHLVVSALANLLQNAIKFTPPGGAVTLPGQSVGNQVQLEVEDQCGGFADQFKIEGLFAPFTQQGTDRTGLGLGLPISRRAAELNGGKLTGRNLPGKGCSFLLELPAGDAGKSPA